MEPSINFYKENKEKEDFWLNKEYLVQLNLTGDCPLNCEFCYMSPHKKEYLSLDKIKKLWENLRRYSKENEIEYRVNLTGGDIFEHPDWIEIAEFIPLLLNEFIEKVVVYEPVKENGKRNQRVDIYLNFIGQFTHPITEELPQEQPKKGSRGRKLRHEMTEEEIQKERERDRERYARKVADKKAKEQAERLAILQGTKYEIKISEEQINKGA